MAICLNNLKSEIKTLEKLFSKSHEIFQIVNASVDELTCRFISKNGKKYDIHANITVSPCLIFSLVSSLDDSSKIKNGSSSCCWCGKLCERSAFRGKWCRGARYGKPQAGDAVPTENFNRFGKPPKKWRKQRSEENHLAHNFLLLFDDVRTRQTKLQSWCVCVRLLNPFFSFFAADMNHGAFGRVNELTAA